MSHVLSSLKAHAGLAQPERTPEQHRVAEIMAHHNANWSALRGCPRG